MTLNRTVTLVLLTLVACGRQEESAAPVAQKSALQTSFDTAAREFQVPVQLLESIAYDPKTQDLSVEVTKIRALKPDLVLVVTRAADAIKLVRDMVRQRFEPMGIISPGSPGLYDEEFYKALGPLADYPIYNIPWANPKSVMITRFGSAESTTKPIAVSP